MAQWEINKGVGRTVEFKGLKAQYLFLFAGGLLAVFFLVVVLYLCGIDQIVCLGLGLVVYVVKQKCTTANIVIYSDISLFYYQKFFC